MTFVRKLRALIALAGLCACVAACGAAPAEDEPVTATESAQMFTSGYIVAAGAYSCGGESWFIDEPLTQAMSRRAAGLSNVLRTNFGAGTGTGPADGVAYYNRVSFLCGEWVIPVSPTCGSSGRLCSIATSSTCQMLSKRAGASTWSFSGWLDVIGSAGYLPDLSAAGLWEFTASYHYVPANPGNGDGMCPGVHVTTPHPPVQTFDIGA